MRYYSLLLSTLLTAAIATCLLVLAGTLADCGWLRATLLLTTALALVTLLVRISAGVIKATGP